MNSIQIFHFFNSTDFKVLSKFADGSHFLDPKLDSYGNGIGGKSVEVVVDGSVVEDVV